jgi:hypothetical protein
MEEKRIYTDYKATNLYDFAIEITETHPDELGSVNGLEFAHGQFYKAIPEEWKKQKIKHVTRMGEHPVYIYNATIDSTPSRLTDVEVEKLNKYIDNYTQEQATKEKALKAKAKAIKDKCNKFNAEMHTRLEKDLEILNTLYRSCGISKDILNDLNQRNITLVKNNTHTRIIGVKTKNRDVGYIEFDTKFDIKADDIDYAKEQFDRFEESLYREIGLK